MKARHSRGAHAISSDNMGGLEPVVYLAKGAKSNAYNESLD